MEQSDFNYSRYCFQQLLIGIEAIQKAIENKNFFSLDIYFMEEVEVLEFLKISRSTLFNYRRKNKIQANFILGRNIYLRHQVYKLLLENLLK